MRSDLRSPGWVTVGTATVRGRAFADGRLLDAGGIAARFDDVVTDGSSLRTITAVASELEGFFAAVVDTGSAVYLVADRARTIPLYHAAEGGLVSDRGRVVRNAVGGETDPVAESEFLLTRYVTGSDTIWAGVASVRPGEVVALDGGEIRRRRYWEYWPGTDGGANDKDPRRTLREGFETALDRLERVAGDRPVVVPLSGGYDSRLIAAGLVSRDREVVGFTFGRSGHPDVELSREVADRLGVRWEFVPYSAANWRERYRSDACRRYRRNAFGGDALPFLAEWPAVHRLLEEERVPADALFCPGHTVATPSERLPAFVGEVDDSTKSGCLPGDRTDTPIEPTMDALLEYVLDRHYNLWGWNDPAFADAARGRIERGLLGDRPADVIDSPTTAAAAYERWEWEGRMTTFTNGDLRVYEDAGVEWWLPLWDPAYVRAWSQLPLDARRGKRAHAALAAEYYRLVSDVPPERAELTDRELSPLDRHLSLVRHTPTQQFNERDGQWDPPFLAPRSRWHSPGSHPLDWDGMVSSGILDAVPESCDLYALRTLEATGRLDLADPDGDVPEDGTITLPTEEG